MEKWFTQWETSEVGLHQELWECQVHSDANVRDIWGSHNEKPIEYGLVREVLTVVYGRRGIVINASKEGPLVHSIISNVQLQS